MRCTTTGPESPRVAESPRTNGVAPRPVGHPAKSAVQGRIVGGTVRPQPRIHAARVSAPAGWNTLDGLGGEIWCTVPRGRDQAECSVPPPDEGREDQKIGIPPGETADAPSPCSARRCDLSHTHETGVARWSDAATDGGCSHR